MCQRHEQLSGQASSLAETTPPKSGRMAPDDQPGITPLTESFVRTSYTAPDKPQSPRFVEQMQDDDLVYLIRSIPSNQASKNDMLTESLIDIFRNSAKQPRSRSTLCIPRRIFISWMNPQHSSRGYVESVCRRFP